MLQVLNTGVIYTIKNVLSLVPSSQVLKENLLFVMSIANAYNYFQKNVIIFKKLFCKILQILILCFYWSYVQLNYTTTFPNESIFKMLNIQQVH